MNAIAQTLRRLLRSARLEVRAYNCSTSPALRLMRQLAHHRIDLVLDVGANDGGFGRFLYANGYAGRVLSFEPQAAAHHKLSQAAKAHAGWTVAERCAVGEREGKLTLNVSRNTLSSSALPMLEAHRAAAPESEYVGKEEVPVYTLDALHQKLGSPQGRTLLKIDTQGYEAQVLDGAAALLPRVQGVYLEMSLTPLYEGQALFDVLHGRLTGLGFEYWGASPGFSDERTGRVLQIDGAYFRK